MLSGIIVRRFSGRAGQHPAATARLLLLESLAYRRIIYVSCRSRGYARFCVKWRQSPTPRKSISYILQPVPCFFLRSVPMKAKIRKWFTYEKDRGMPEAILTKKSGLRRRQRAIVAVPPQWRLAVRSISPPHRAHEALECSRVLWHLRCRVVSRLCFKQEEKSGASPTAMVDPLPRARAV